MNYKKAILLVCSFLLLLALAFPVSNLQSLQADQILTENGLSADTREFVPRRRVRIRTLLKHLQAGPKMQVHLTDESQPSRVLVWANYNLRAMPVTSGRYFDRNDFTGQVTFAVVSPTVEAGLLTTQNNRYVEDGDRFLSVIGILKNNQEHEKTRYYLTTGLKQANSRDLLTNYRLTIDGLSRSQLNQLSRYLHARPQVPAFVAQFRHRHRSYRALQWLFGLLLCCLLVINTGAWAWLNQKQPGLGRIHGQLLNNWLFNRAFRFCLLQACLAVVAYWLMSSRVFFSAGKYYAWLLIFACLLEMAVYVIVSLHFNPRERSPYAAK